MKNKILTIFIALTCCIMYMPQINAQTAEDRTWMSVYFGHHEYDGDYGNEMLAFDVPNDFGAGAGVQQYLNPSFDLDFTTYVGRLDYEFSANSFSKRMVNMNLLLHYKLTNGYLFKESSVVKPFVFAGFGGSLFVGGDEFDTRYVPNSETFQIPLGVGFSVPIKENIYFNYKTTYNRTFSDDIDGNTTIDSKDHDDALVHTIGVKFRLGRVSDADKDGIRDTRDACPDTFGDAKTDGCPDRDGDTVIDSKDRCPNQAGLVEFAGCPDTDADGVPNYEDRCPEIAGTVAFQGCTDKDSDGIGDNVDACPNVAGTKATNGCPDNDKDGIKNSDDDCPNRAGITSNSGCPAISQEVTTEVNLIFNNIYFATDKATIHESSIESLNKLVSLLEDDKDLKLNIAGYADSRDTKEYNMQLSEERASAVKSYLTKKGIASSRITTKGFGESKPIASNTSADGKSRNRRVELTLSYN